MPKPSLANVSQAADGESVCLLAGSYDPPHVDYFRAAMALRDLDGVDHVWLAPCSDDDERNEIIRETCGVLVAEMTGVGLCTAGLDGVEDVLGWCRRLYPYFRFKLARLYHGDADVIVAFSGQNTHAGDGLVLPLHWLPQRDDLVTGIREGSDESRAFTAGVWSYIMRNRLYRE